MSEIPIVEPGASSAVLEASPTCHPDTLLRMALAVWPLVAPATISPVQRQWLTTRLASLAPFTEAERSRILPLVLAAIEGYDDRCGAVVRSHLQGDPDPPWRGARSHEGAVKLFTIVKTLQDAADQAALDEPAPSARRGKRKRKP